VREGLVSGNPAAGIELARGEVLPPPRLGEADWNKIISFIEHKIGVEGDPILQAIYVLDALIFRLMFNLGLRVSEAHSLRLSRMREEEGELRAIIVKKGDKVRVVPIVGRVRVAYDRWMIVRSSFVVHPDHADFVVVHPKTSRRTGRKRAWRRCRLIASEAGLSPELVRHFTPHKLRHAIGYLEAEHRSITDVQSLLDHSNLSSTQVYTEHSQSAAWRFSGRLAIVDQLMAAGPTQNE
jgi:integrase